MEATVLPKQFELKKIFISVKAPVINMALIFLGCLVFTIGMNSILVPYGFLSGGLVGLSMLVHYLIPTSEIGWTYFILNIPLAVLGWMNISRRFMIYSLFGMGFFSFTAAAIHTPAPDIQDPMLAAIFAGVICGTGAGIILRSVGSAGGMDILSIYLNKKFGFRIGSITFIANALVLVAGTYFYDLQMLLYSIVYLFTSSKVMDAIITGFNQRKSLMVISEQADKIAQSILDDKGRGVTFLKGEGAFTGREKKVILTITTLTEMTKMKELVLNIDPNAFMVVNDTLEVLGKRHGRGRVY